MKRMFGLKRITAFTLAILLFVGNILPAFAADGWIPAKWVIENSVGKDYIDYTFSSSVKSQLEGGSFAGGATATGLSLELTFTQKKSAYSTTNLYDKWWTMDVSAESKDVKLADGSILTIDFSKLSSQYASCIADHTSDAGKGTIAYRSQLFVPLENVYFPSATDMTAYPEHIKKGGYTGQNAKFMLLLQMLSQTLHQPTESECKDDTAGTIYSMIAYMTARCIEDGKFKGTDANADWAAITAHSDYGMLKQWFCPDNNGSSTVWNSLNSTGKEYFLLCWEYASFMSYFDYSVEDKKVVVLMPQMTDSEEGSTYSKTLDYSSYNTLAKKHFQELSMSSSGGITVTNDGSKLTISSSSPLDDSTLSGLGLNYGGSEKKLVPAFLVGVKMVLRGNDGTPYLAGQTRFLAGTTTLDKIHIRKRTGRPPSSHTSSGSAYPDITRYEYRDSFTADYNIRVKKYDSETGQPLADSHFDITETLNEDSIDGCLTDGSNYDEVDINDDCDQNGHVTNDDGVLTYGNGKTAHKDVRTYSYHKGYCEGHPAAEDFYPEEPDSEDEEAHSAWEDECAEIDAKFAEELALCQDTLGGNENGSNGFYCFGESDPDGSQAKAAFEANRDECYEAFIRITYDYTVTETQARKGYVLHGNHTDDVPIETDTVYSSQYIEECGGHIACANPQGDLSVIRKERIKALADAKLRDAAESILGMGILTAYAAEQETAPQVDPENGTAIEAAVGSGDEAGITEGDSSEKDAEETTGKETAGEIEVGKEGASGTESEESEEEEQHSEEITETVVSEKEIEEVIEEESVEEEYLTPYDEDLARLKKLKEKYYPEDAEDGEVEEDGAEDLQIATPSEATPMSAVYDSDIPSEEEISLLEAVLIELRELWLSFWGVVTDIAEDAADAVGEAAEEAKEFLVAPLMLLGLSVSSGNSGAYYAAYSGWVTSDIAVKDKGDQENVDHTFIVFDHRTEGEVHFNKRDLDLAEKENADYDAYGDSNGDSTLEGAVYGLFAAEDIIHPDGHTGTVYAKDDIVAIATTDRNGDASFTVFTEAPGNTWDYTAGTVKATGTAQKLNMHRKASDPQAQLGTKDYEGLKNVTAVGASDAAGYQKKSSNQTSSYPISNNEDNNGNCWIGRPLITAVEGTGYYIKELTRSEGYELSVTGKKNEITNGKGSENEGVSTQKISLSATQIINGTDADPVVIPIAAAVSVTGQNVTGDITVKVTNAGEGAAAALSEKATVTDPYVIEAIPYTQTEYSYPDSGTPVVIDNTQIEAGLGEIKTVSSGSYTVTAVSDPVPQNRSVEFKEPYIKTIPAALTGYTSRESFVAAYNTKLGENGFSVPDADAPWIRVPLTGSNSVSWSAAVVKAIKDNGLLYVNRMRVALDGSTAVIKYDSYDGLHKMLNEGFEDLTNSILYVRYETDQNYFVYLPFDKDDATSVISYKTEDGHVTAATIKGYTVSAFGAYPAAISVTKAEIPDKTYWAYDGSMKAFDPASKGDIAKKTVTRSIVPTDPEWGDSAYQNAAYKGWKYTAGTKTTETVTPLVSAYDSAEKSYYVTIPKSAFAASGEKTVTLKLYDSGAGTYSPKVTDLFTYVPTSANEDSYRVTFTMQDTYDGTESPVMYATAAVSVTEGGKARAKNQDTVKDPLIVYERPIRQKVRLSKDISLNADMDSDGTGDAYRNNTYDADTEVKLTNFRFKAYLKSNLERLYRDENGNITWLDRNGNEISPVVNADGSVSWKYLAAYSGKTVDYPEEDIKTSAGRLQSVNVNKIYTKVLHNVNSLTFSQRANNVWNSYITPQGGTISNVGLIKALVTKERTGADGNAVTVNTNLYSYDGKCSDKDASDKINAVANTGFTRILEMKLSDIEDGTGLKESVESYDYGKFFDAIAVANGDKWDDAAPTYSSYKPIGNKANRSTEQIENAKRSDRVRQFAITYYLEDEVSKLVTEVAASSGKENEAAADPSDNKYQEQIYDKALNEAIKKAEDYLAPFFKYDLDAIYAVDWDSETDGGKDGDVHTLSLDTISSKETSAVSAYLPYGEYVIAEEQPRYSGSSYAYNDVLNKRYKIDEPKEIKIPSLYEGGSSGDTNENYDSHYKFVYGTDLKDMSKSANYLIRFGEEWNDDSDSGTYQSVWVIRAHSDAGDFEVYKYGLDADRMDSNTGKAIASKSGGYSYYGLTVSQDSHEPLKDYYNTSHLGTVPFGSGTEAIGEVNGGNDGSRYYIDSKAVNNSVTANGSHYKTKELKNRLYYGAVSEDKGTREIISHGISVTEDNRTGMEFKTVTSMTGSLTAYDGEYAPMLVPWTVTEGAYSSAAYTGYADKNIRNEFYSAKLRIEKIDSETHENILHDGAVFAIYKAERSASSGNVMYYTADVDVTGSKEFIESYCIKNTAMPVNPEDPRGLYKGTVAAGTPVCHEKDKVILGDRYGNQVSEFKAFSTVIDVAAKDEMTDTMSSPATYMYQSAGYIETPQPIGAGTYVICECVVPSGYVRTAPVAVEVYSDKVAYYSEGNIDKKVLAAVYEDETGDEATNNGNKPQDTQDVARVYVEDTPIKLTFEKVKESSAMSADTTADKSVTYKVSGRVNGKLTEIGGRDDMEYAYRSGRYQGYGWYKGTLEYLAQLKAAYETDADPLTDVEIIYDGTLFAGYGYVTRALETSDDTNKYVTGATLTLYDAVNLRRNSAYEFGKSDYAFSFPKSVTENHGLIIERDLNSNVKRMYVEKGYAGTKTTFIPERDADGNPVTTTYLTGYAKDGKPIYETGYIWDSETIEREDTDILYYDLDSLQITVDVTVDGINKHYGYDKDHRKVEIDLIEKDKANVAKTDNEHSIYAFKGGMAVLEFVGGDFTKISYSKKDKTITVDENTLVYHLDTDGNRDSLVDPYTGMAYLIETCDDGKGGTYDKYMVWAVEVYKDQYGNVISRDKITTSRVGTIGENDSAMTDAYTEIISAADPAGGVTSYKAASYEHNESGSITGTWHSAAGEESHSATSDRTNPYGGKMNGQTLIADNNGSFVKEYAPVYDKNGNVVYYQRSAETYDKGTDLYDRNDDFVRYDSADDLEEYNLNAYRINSNAELYDTTGTDQSPDTKKLYHREGEGYVLQNTWVTSDHTPNDPFDTEATDGQADILKRVPAGMYICEEISVPSGSTNGAYLKAFPVAVTVNEETKMQAAKMIDKTTKLEIAKVDGTDSYRINILAMENGKEDIGDYLDEKTSYSYGIVPGAELALYKAKKVYSSDYEKYPKGYYLVKDGNDPLMYHDTSWTVSVPVLKEARWTTAKNSPIYIEGIPQGFYILEELTVPSGFVKASSIGIEIDTDMNVHTVLMNEDHTKVEVKKVYFDDYEKETLLKGARLNLHEAKTDGSGNVLYDADGKPAYEPEVVVSWTTSDDREWANLAPAFREMFDKYGLNGSSFSYIDADGYSHTLTRTAVDYALDVSLAGGISTEYPTDARVIFEDASGRKVRVSVYEEKTASGKKTYTYDFEYDWIALTSVNAYADSYMTVEGIRRFNYLPVGKKYVVVESSAPTGFAKATPKVISVEETADIQRYFIEDTRAQLVISKVKKGKTQEMPGAVLSLYKAEGTLFVKDAAHLVATWESGSDGVYDSTDLLYGRILSGYKVGDLRPHTLKTVDAGTYYLVEDRAPDYHNIFEPVKIDYTDITEIKFVRVENCPVEGEINITKENESGEPLSGAVYRLRTYRPSDLVNPVSDVTYTAVGSVLKISGLAVGEEDIKGNITPYTYILTEVRAPEGYEIGYTTYRFSFDKDNGGDSYAFGNKAVKDFVFKDKKTSFTFSKKDFESVAGDTAEDVFVEGAAFKLYEMTGIDANGEPVYDPAAPLKAFTTKRLEKEVVIEGLVAGKSYVFVEEAASDGYTSMIKPLAFTVSADGRHIQALSNKLSALTFVGIKETDYVLDTVNRDTDSIMSVIMHGRYVTTVTDEVTDDAGMLKESWPGGSTHVINIGSGYVEGKAYTLTEKTAYSDGTVLVTDMETRNFHFDENGNMTISSRKEDKVTFGVYRSDGLAVEEISPVGAADFERVITNSVMPENPIITMQPVGGDKGDVLDPERLVINEVTFVNPYHIAKDAVVKIHVTDDTGFALYSGGSVSGNTLTYKINAVAPFGSEKISFYTNVKGNASVMDVTVEIGDKTLIGHMNTPVIKKNCLTLFNSLTGSGKTVYADEESSYKISLFYNTTGDELAGTYSYSGSRTGTIQSGDEIILKGNEYVFIDTGIFEDVHYRVERTEDGRNVTSKQAEGDFTDKTGGFALFTRSLPDTSVRDVFMPGEVFDVYEKTSFTDGDTITTNRLQFTVGSSNAVAFDLQTKVSISKLSMTDGEYIEGIDLELYDESGTLIDAWKSGKEPHLIEGKLITKSRYRLVEKSVDTAPGWAYTKDIWFTVDSFGYVLQKVKMYDKPTRVHLTKKDITTGSDITGCVFEFIDTATDRVTATAETTAAGIDLVGVLEADHTYKVIEKTPAAGYYAADPVYITVSHDGTKDSLLIKDVPKPGYEMKKERVTLAPAKTKNSYGFHRGGTVLYDVTIKNTGGMDLQMTVNDGFDASIAEYFETPAVEKVAFYDSATGAEDAAKGSLIGTDGSKADIIIRKSGYAVVTYKSKVKLTAPQKLAGHTADDGIGYQNTAETTDVKGKYTEYDTGTEKTVTKEECPEDIPDKNDDAHTPVQIDSGGGGDDPDRSESYVELMKNTVDNKFVRGAKISLYRGDGSSDGTFISSGYTDANGRVRLKTIGVGTYYYVETEAPSGFSRDPSRHVIEIDAFGKIISGSGTLTDDYARVSISKVDAITGEELEGAVFTLYQMDGTPVMTAVSGPEGYAEFTKVLHGRYYIMETDAPEGHTLSPEKRYVKISKFYTNAPPIVWPNQPGFGRLKFKDHGKLRGATGDGSNMLLAFIILCVGIAGFVFFTGKSKKKKKEDS